MILFRKIRQKLAAENKAAKYVRYAIGEILLVVIGILYGNRRFEKGLGGSYGRNVLQCRIGSGNWREFGNV